MSEPAPVIVNPGARGARAGGRVAVLRALNPSPRVLETRAAGDARAMARELAERGAPLIVAAGGDGTVNEVVNGIADAGAADRVALGVLPMGTMNVFAAELRLPANRLEDCWRLILNGVPREIDLWRVNGVCFVQLAGAGMDAAIIRETTWERKRRFGALSYVMSGLRQMRRRAPLLTVTAPDRPPLAGTAVLAGNGRLYGGPFPLFPGATFTDGLLDVVVVHGQSWLHFLALGRALLSGRYTGAGRLATYFQTGSLTVEGAEPVPCEADGELAGTASPVRLERAGTLRVIGGEGAPG